MRLWTLHPRHLDRPGLTGGWREALLAQAVLAGRTRGYRHHPQLERFAAHPDPLAAVGAFLTVMADEADARGYRFDRSRIDRPGPVSGVDAIPATTGQVEYEWAHLRAKLAARSPDWLARWAAEDTPEVHPLFTVEDGPLASWERP
ncbi:pyrimidine dimer DNA glycosylase/endonuclease V [Micrococcus sp.]|uniref:pyrimidine dimer DNA glycosylase/endonuclease V n=1 Tax=Micrococcus sp. TaxID=1271 RepID=UPI002A90923B|nr:pyrimidine dimer DNA glycosylase/endonuclease V [Micrococcus sp.]MDY6055401.1 pyrimidine dimer DNA glycosylase/endonuclease V [Micrococcus sp.]